MQTKCSTAGHPIQMDAKQADWLPGASTIKFELHRPIAISSHFFLNCQTKKDDRKQTLQRERSHGNAQMH